MELNRQKEQATIDDNQNRAFLQANGLPQSLYSITAQNELPADLWIKIEEFQKKGAIQNIQGLIEALGALKANNNGLLEGMKRSVEEEETSDNVARQQFGARWSRMPSNALNQ